MLIRKAVLGLAVLSLATPAAIAQEANAERYTLEKSDSGFVRLDEAGAWLYQRPGPAARKLGSALLGLAPRMMRALGVLGTLAMFLVGGEILAHALPSLEERVAVWVEGSNGVTSYLVHAAVNCTLGLLAGACAAGALQLVKRLRRK